MHTSLTTPRPQDTTTSACPFAVRFGRALPAGFADEAAGLTWRRLVETFAPSTGSFHLADLSVLSRGRGVTTFEATLSRPGVTGTRTRRLSVDATGPISAMSEMLASLGAHVETERFHQYSADGTWCTILRATDGRRSTWALGFGSTSGEAGAHALLAAAGRLHL